MQVTVIPEINLLKGRREALRRERLAFAKVQFVVMVILVCYIGMLAVVIGLQAFINLQHKRVTGGIQAEEMALAQLKPVEEKYTIVANKLALISDYLNSKGKVREALWAIYQSLPEGMQLGSVALSDDENQVVIQAVAKDMHVVTSYMDLVEQEVKDNRYAHITLSGIARGPDGTYSVNSEYAIAE